MDQRPLTPSQIAFANNACGSVLDTALIESQVLPSDACDGSSPHNLLSNWRPPSQQRSMRRFRLPQSRMNSAQVSRCAPKTPALCWQLLHIRYQAIATAYRQCRHRTPPDRTEAGCPYCGVLPCPRDRFIECRNHLTVTGVIVHALDVVKAAAHGHRQQDRIGPGLRPVQVHQPGGAAQRADGTTAAVAGFITPLHPILPVLDQRSADRQDLQRQQRPADWPELAETRGAGLIL